MKKILISTLTLLTIGVTASAQDTWLFDKAHSKVAFSVNHLVISETTGFFKIFEGEVISQSDDFTDSQVKFAVDVASIDTDNEQRDTHLRSDDFFNSEAYPRMTFASKSFKKVDDKHYELTGDLTIRDVTQPITLDVTHNGTVNDPWGNTVAGFKVEGKLNRFDYGLKWNKVTEAGGLVVGEEVRIVANIELQKQKQASSGK